ncbi:MAG: hypothetical protein PHV17_06230 [Candidatus Omnitrophica bacterium]|nr:hypothetical protein [Candidatus Omnitrophota bacterium]
MIDKLSPKQKKHRSIGVIVFGWSEIVIGLLGSIMFLFSLHWVGFNAFFLIKTSIEGVFTVGIDFNRLFLGSLYCLMTIPFVVILFLGAGTLQCRPYARRRNMFFLPFLLVSVVMFALIGFPVTESIMNQKSWLVTIIPLCFFSLFKIWFFNRPNIKKQFSRD